MKIRLLKKAHVPAPAGTEIELVDSQARLLIAAGIAVKVEAVAVETAVKAPTETAEKKSAPKKKATKKKAE